jgi:hypothetical protein
MEPLMQEMTEDYFLLSLVTGMFVMQADTLLGRSHFIPLAHAHQWELTWELLGQWMKDAVMMGFPKESFNDLRDILREHVSIIPV